MMRRVVAGIVLGLIVFGAASIVSRGQKNPAFLKPMATPGVEIWQSTTTASSAR